MVEVSFDGFKKLIDRICAIEKKIGNMRPFYNDVKSFLESRITLEQVEDEQKLEDEKKLENNIWKRWTKSIKKKIAEVKEVWNGDYVKNHAIFNVSKEGLEVSVSATFYEKLRQQKGKRSNASAFSVLGITVQDKAHIKEMLRGYINVS